jgi:hypothetical protein
MYTESSKGGNLYPVHKTSARGEDVGSMKTNPRQRGVRRMSSTCVYLYGCRRGAKYAHSTRHAWQYIRRKQPFRLHVAFEACLFESIRDESILVGGFTP